jgi:hypothetical protein
MTDNNYQRHPGFLPTADEWHDTQRELARLRADNARLHELIGPVAAEAVMLRDRLAEAEAALENVDYMPEIRDYFAKHQG